LGETEWNLQVNVDHKALADPPHEKQATSPSPSSQTGRRKLEHLKAPLPILGEGLGERAEGLEQRAAKYPHYA
jgi:hypothetical protein